MEKLALESRARAIAKLQDEMAQQKVEYLETLDDAFTRATDLEEAMTEAMALDEVAVMKKILDVIAMSREDEMANDRSLETAADNMVVTAQALRDEEAKEQEVGMELNEIDLADIEEMEQLVPVSCA